MTGRMAHASKAEGGNVMILPDLRGELFRANLLRECSLYGVQFGVNWT